jgi:7-cyano-7-deazaguanine synthase
LNKHALVLFSGGQDSTTCLALALEKYDHVETIGFDYAQRHIVELETRLTVINKIREEFPNWGAKLGQDHMIDLSALGRISDTSLTTDGEIRMNENGLPNTFVPGRNLMFLTFAAAVGYRRGLDVLVTGVCESDYSGYPDCRDDTIKATQISLSLGMAHRFNIETPLMWINKAQTWELANQLGGEKLNNLILEYTHTCYQGDRSNRFDWGYGCGECPACELRANGFHAWQLDSKNVAPMHMTV